MGNSAKKINNRGSVARQRPLNPLEVSTDNFTRDRQVNGGPRPSGPGFRPMPQRGARPIVRCDRCGQLLHPPPGNPPLFSCTCGAVLRTPGLNNNRIQQATLRGRLKIKSDDPADYKSLEDLLAESKGHSKAGEHWLRNLGEGHKLFWVRLMSPEQEAKISKLLDTWEEDMKKNIGKLGHYDLKLRFEQLGAWQYMSEEQRNNLEDLRGFLLQAKARMKEDSNVESIVHTLNKLNVDHTSCVGKDQCIERLMAAVWYGPTRLCDGFVRLFTDEYDLDMIPAQQYGLDLDYKIHRIRNYDIERLSQAPFSTKVAWFRSICEKHRNSQVESRVTINISRNDVLAESFYAFSKLNVEHFKCDFKFEFKGEIGIDVGGLAREWFELISDACFNVNCGLFEYSAVDNICYNFNPASGLANELHGPYFRFIGRVLGKALFDERIMRAYLIQPIFKHILGFPITVDDIQYCDEKIHQSLKEIEEMEEDVEDLLLTFSCTKEIFGEVFEVELKPGGGDIAVTNANVQEYILLMTKHYMFERTKTQLAHFLRGIYDVIPELWLSIFDHKELELLLCGLPEINVNDWKDTTVYRGAYVKKGEKHNVVKWFWEYVFSCDQEQRARILQFATGTSRVPLNGFAALQGRKDN